MSARDELKQLKDAAPDSWWDANAPFGVVNNLRASHRLAERLLDAVERAVARPGHAWCREHCSCVTYIDGILRAALKGER